VVWNHHLRHNPANPKWPDRDRFVLSNGHGSMLLYALLHLTGYDLPMDEIKRFRQLHSRTPGHPEVGLTPGVETTTGPLGQGIANAVGMAIAERTLAAEFNRPGFEIINHHTYVFAGDGCMMEGISHEACSLAGTFGLGKLILFYDDNGVSIDGDVEGWFTDDTPKRFEAYGWHVVPNVNGHDSAAVEAALTAAKANVEHPSLICCKTVIAQGSPNKAGSHEAHGAPLGEAEVAATRTRIGWSHPPFVIPKDVYDGWDARVAGARAESLWNERFSEYARAYPELAAEFKRRMEGELPANWKGATSAIIADVASKLENVATRKASQYAIDALAALLPELVGGSADLTGSNLTLWSNANVMHRARPGNYVYYGVREFAMSAITNGMILHGGVRAYGGTFLMFSEYARNALRMAALMKVPSIFVYSHDSIGLGEDGPTHQPVEQTATLRLIPGMDVWRPCDAVESTVCWIAALERRDGPSCLLFTRQNVPFQKRAPEHVENVRHGGYVLSEAVGAAPAAVLIATGSEVAIAIDAQKLLAEEGVPVRVVSMPSTSVFDRQEDSYKASVLPSGVKRIAVEAGVTDGWRKYVGLDGAVLGIDGYGESAPSGDLFEHFGFTAANLARIVKAVL
jgi:transketolase